MEWIQAGKAAINLDHVVLVEQLAADEDVFRVHFTPGTCATAGVAGDRDFLPFRDYRGEDASLIRRLIEPPFGPSGAG